MGMIMMLVWLFVLVALVVWIVNLFTSRSRNPGAHPSREALDIAEKRYARGEITQGELEQIKRELRE